MRAFRQFLAYAGSAARAARRRRHGHVRIEKSWIAARSSRHHTGSKTPGVESLQRKGDSLMEIDPVQALRARHEAQGLRLHARTAIPGWLGERLDVGWAIDVMHPLAG